MLKVDQVTLNFDRVILDNISLTVKEGEFLGIVGKSGAGKTSLLKIMSGLLQPSSGRVELYGEAVRGPNIKLVPGHPEIQLVNQDFHLDTYHTVEENIREQILYLPLKEREQLVGELLELVELDEIKHQKAITLSGGEQQRLALARALACEPKLILLDEPFVHLDRRLRSKLVKYLLDLREIRGTSFVLVSHDGAEMLALSDKILCIKKGRIYRQGKPKDLFYKPKSIEEAKLFGHVNSVRLENKRILFRADEFTTVFSPQGIPLDLIFDKAIFIGGLYENYFYTSRKESVMLYSINNELTHVHKGYIVKQN
jgi:ABC-type Fe3+/spermidine/putrescine transport system ATPase subunit